MAEYRRFPYGDWWRRLLEPVSVGGIPAERRSLPLPVGLVSKIIITGQAMSARISRKEIHYVLFKKHKLLDVRFILFLLLFYHGSLLPVFPDLVHDINHISKSDTGIIFALFLCSRYYSNRCLVCFLTNSGCANTCCGLLPAC